MGKAKKRSLHLGINNMIPNISREEALKKVLRACSLGKVGHKTKGLIELFGFSCEELLEYGAKYEDVMSMKTILKS